jgi:hypothetical protein
MSSKFYPGCFQLYPFLSDRRITVDIARAGYAKATYECLPCELRDLVYAYLWATIYITMTAPPSFKSINENLDMAITRVRHLGFGAPKILGYEVALEAFQWLYEYGILGYKIPLHTLGHYLATRKNSGRVVPAECRLRSINVMKEWRVRADEVSAQQYVGADKRQDCRQDYRQLHTAPATRSGRRLPADGSYRGYLH